MDEFKPEEELKPDISDRRLQRARKTSPVTRLPVSRQYIMAGTGILVLLLLLAGIGSALNVSGSATDIYSRESGNTGSGNEVAAPSAGHEKSIDLSEVATMRGQAGNDTAEAPAESKMPSSFAPVLQGSPVMPSAPETETAAPVQNQQRVELTGDLASALSRQQGQVNVATQQVMDNSSSLPVAEATVNSGASRAVNNAKPLLHPATRQSVKAAGPDVKNAKVLTQSSKPPAQRAASAASGPVAGHYTLQLSSASRADTLKSWAEQHKLSDWHIYQTAREGKPWYVLVYGSWATSAEARRAVVALPAAVQAKHPWVRPASQIKKENSRQ